MEDFLKWISVCLLSGVKFIFGPTFGLAYQIPVLGAIILTTLGMMLAVYMVTFFNPQIRALISKYRKNKKKFTKRNRQFVTIWKKYGLKGVCLLTPLIFTPIGGALVANIFGNNKKEILKWMWISAIFWSAVINMFVYFAYDWVRGFIH